MTTRRVVVVVWLLTVSASALAVLNIPVTTDITLFLPSGDTSAALVTELRQGPASRLLLLAITAGPGDGRQADTEAAMARASEHLADTVRTDQRFARVVNGSGFGLDGEQQQQQLFDRRYLLSPRIDAARFSAEKLRESLQQRLRELGSPLAAFEKRTLPADPTGELRAMLRHWQPARQPGKRHGVWFSNDGERALLLAETHASGFDLNAQEHALRVVTEAFEKAKIETGADGLRLQMSGTGVFATESRTTIRSESELLSAAATLFVVLWLLLAYRSPRLVVLGALPLVTGLLCAAALTGLLFGTLYGLTLAFGITLLGVAIDYPIHLFSHLAPQHPASASMARIWPTLRLGVATTAIGYLAIMTTHFGGLAQLGVFAVTGLLAAAATTRWLLPALLATPRRHPAGSGIRWQSHWSQRLLRPPPALAAALLIASLLSPLTWWLSTDIWQDDLAALSPVPAAAIEVDRLLRAELGAAEAGKLVMIRAADAETALRLSETVAARLQTMAERKLLVGFDAPSRYLPSQQRQIERRRALPQNDQLRRRLNQALIGLPFKANAFQPFLEAIAAARGMSPLLPDQIRESALGARVSSLLFPAGEQWLALLPLAQVADTDELASSLADLAASGVRLVDLRAETNRLIGALRDSALARLALGFALIAVVLLIALRSPLRVLAVLLPVVLAVLVDVAVLLALGERLSLFHLVALLLVAGIGLDFALFCSRGDSDPVFRARTLHAVAICGGSTVAVFGIVGVSELPVLKAIGQTVAIGVAAAFVLALAIAQQAPKTDESNPDLRG